MGGKIEDLKTSTENVLDQWKSFLRAYQPGGSEYGTVEEYWRRGEELGLQDFNLGVEFVGMQEGWFDFEPDRAALIKNNLAPFSGDRTKFLNLAAQSYDSETRSLDTLALGVYSVPYLNLDVVRVLPEIIEREITELDKDAYWTWPTPANKSRAKPALEEAKRVVNFSLTYLHCYMHYRAASPANAPTVPAMETAPPPLDNLPKLNPSLSPRLNRAAGSVIVKLLRANGMFHPDLKLKDLQQGLANLTGYSKSQYGKEIQRRGKLSENEQFTSSDLLQARRVLQSMLGALEQELADMGRPVGSKDLEG